MLVMEWLFRQSRAETTTKADNRKQYQHRDLPLRGRVGEKTKGRAAILHMGDTEEPGNHLFAIVQRDVFRDRPLGDAIEHHDREGDEEMKPAHYVVIGHWDLRDSDLRVGWQSFRGECGNCLDRNAGSGQGEGGFRVERHSLIYSQMADFFHYREHRDERPFRAPCTLVKGTTESTVEKRVKKCTILLEDDFLRPSI